MMILSGLLNYLNQGGDTAEHFEKVRSRFPGLRREEKNG